MADRPVLPCRGQHLHHAELEADGLPPLVGQDQPDPVVARRIAARRADPPRPVHAQVRVHRDAAVHPGQQVLAAGHRLDHPPPGQVGRRIPGDAKVAAGQHLPGQRVMQLPRRPPHHVTLGHPASMPPAAVSIVRARRARVRSGRTPAA